MSKKEIAVKEETQVAAFVPQQEEILGTMIYLPRLSLVQKMSSNFIKAGAKEGDFFDGLTSSIVAPKGEHFTFVPLKVQPILMTERQEGKKWSYDSHVPLTTANENTPWDEYRAKDKKGIEQNYRPRPVVQVYMLGYNQLAAGNEAAMPYVFTFKGASTKYGKGLYTQSNIIGKMKGVLHHTKFNLKSAEGKNDSGDEYMLAVVSQPLGKLVDMEKNMADLWYQSIATTKVEAVGEEADEADKATRTQY